MKKTKMISAFMAAVMGIASVPVLSTQFGSYAEIRANAATNVESMQPVDSTFEFIKEVEGFMPRCMWDVHQWTIGYGNRCPYEHSGDGVRGQYGGHTITEEEARELFSEKLGGYVATLKSNCSGLSMTQEQFDALLSATYNHGNVNYCPLKYYLQGKLSESEARAEYYEWCINAGTADEAGLRNRRRKEADLFFSNANHLPESSFDSYSISGSTLHISGWAFDPDTTDQSVSVHVYAKNAAGEDIALSGSVIANKSRPDVDEVYGCGADHGFEADIPLTIPEGTYTVQIALLDTETDEAAWNVGGEFIFSKPKAAGSDIGDDFIGYMSYDQMYMIASSDKTVKMASRWDPNPYASSMTATKYMWHFIRDKNNYKNEPVYSIWSYNAYKNAAGEVKGPALKWNDGSDAVIVSNDISPDELAHYRWRLIKISDETYQIQPVSSDTQVITMPDTNQNTAVRLAKNTKDGKQSFYFYNIAKDEESPTIYSVTSNTLDNNSFKLTIDTNDNIGVKKVEVITHSWRNDKEVTFNATQKDASHWECTIKNSSFNNDYGAFYSIVKVYDFKGNGATKIKSVESYDSTGKQISKSKDQHYVESRVGVYTLTMDPNGGTADLDTKTLVYGGKYSRGGDLPVPVRKGYSFDGWYTAKDGGTKVTDDTAVTQKADHTIYAHWTINKVNVCYNANGGTIASGGDYYLGSDANVYTVKDEKILSSSWSYNQKRENGLYNAASFRLSRTGYTFVGWGTEKNSSKIFDQDDASVSANDLYPDITSKSGTVTLYAQWKAKSVSVTFYRNQSESDTSAVKETFTYDTANQKFGYKTDGTGRYSTMNDAKVGFGAWTKTGYQLLGWNAQRDAGSAKYSTYSGVTNNWIDSNSPSVSLYAQWKANTYTVTFVPDSGTCAETTRKVTYDAAYGADKALPVPVRDGYTFVGWYLEDAFQNMVSDSTVMKKASDHKLYAKWKQDVQPATAEPSVIRGDVNADSSVTVQDAIALQKWILAKPGAKLGSAEASDLNGDGVVDIFDLALLKKMLLK